MTTPTAQMALDRIGTLVESRDHIEAMIIARVTEARNHGATWDDIGATLGITRQSAWQRYREHAD